jgi:GAF domain-containing protein
MSNEDRRDSLQSLFSGDTTEGEGPGGSLRPASTADLSISGLFSSGTAEDEEARSAEGEERDESATSARELSDMPGALEAEPEEERDQEVRVPGASAKARQQTALEVPDDLTTTAGQATGSDVWNTDAAVPAEIPGVDRQSMYLPSPEDIIDSDLAQERKKVLNALLGAATLGGGIVVALRLLSLLPGPGGMGGPGLLLIGYAAVSAAFVFRRIPSEWRIAILVGVLYATAFQAMLTQGLVGAGPWYLLAIPTVLFSLAGERWGRVSGMANVLLYLAFAAAYRLGWLAAQPVVDVRASLPRLLTLGAAFALLAAAVAIAHSLPARAQRHLRRLLCQQHDVLRAAQAVGAERQQRLERANAALHRQLRHSEFATEMGQLAARGLHLDDLAVRAVELIQRSAAADYVGLFLLDEDRAYAQLHAQAGALGSAALGPGERIPVGDDVLLRQCVSSGRPQVLLGVQDVRDLSGRDGGSPFLHPDARSALALPLFGRGSVFGAVSVQSRAAAAFDNGDVVSLRTTADQLSSAILNARLSQELREHLGQLERLHQYYVREAWEQFLAGHGASTYEYHRPEVEPLGDGPLPNVDRVLADPGLVMLGEDDASTLLVPIVLREHVLGVLGLHGPDVDQPWTEEQMELLAAVSEQMGLTLENARLFATARSQAAQERRARQIVARLRESLDVEHVLATTVQEIGDALRLEDITIRLAETEGPIGG